MGRWCVPYRDVQNVAPCVPDRTVVDVPEEGQLVVGWEVQLCQVALHVCFVQMEEWARQCVDDLLC